MKIKITLKHLFIVLGEGVIDVDPSRLSCSPKELRSATALENDAHKVKRWLLEMEQAANAGRDIRMHLELLED